MATSIPPHNAAELCDAALYLINHPEATSAHLAKFVQGPDFPTGGILVDCDHARALRKQCLSQGRADAVGRAGDQHAGVGKGRVGRCVTQHSRAPPSRLSLPARRSQRRP